MITAGKLLREELKYHERRTEEIRRALALYEGTTKPGKKVAPAPRAPMKAVSETADLVLEVLTHNPQSIEDLDARLNDPWLTLTISQIYRGLKRLVETNQAIVNTEKRSHTWRLPEERPKWPEPGTTVGDSLRDQEEARQDEPADKPERGERRHNGEPKDDGLSRREEVLRYLEENGPATNKTIAEVFGVTPKYVANLMKKIQKEDLVTPTPNPPKRGQETTWRINTREARISAERGELETGRKK